MALSWVSFEEDGQFGRDDEAANEDGMSRCPLGG